MTHQTTSETASAGQNRAEFSVGQLVSVEWEKLGEIVEVLLPVVRFSRNDEPTGIWKAQP